MLPLAFWFSGAILVTGNPLFAVAGDWGNHESAALVTQGGGFSFTVGEDGNEEWDTRPRNVAESYGT